MRSLAMNIRRIRTEIVLILLLSIAILFIPPEAKEGLLALFITKALFVTLGVLYAHASRKFLFAYLNLRELIENHHWGGTAFITVWYGVIIYAFSVGG
jgi:hypothetical protein